MGALLKTVQVMLTVGTLFNLCMVSSGCETNPYTGRSQLLMTSVAEEMQLGAQAYSQVKNDPKVRQSQDPREIEPVKRVAIEICGDGQAVSVGSHRDQG